MSKKILYLPIEIPTRELDAKLLLAVKSCCRGYAVIIGSKEILNIAKKMCSGILIYKDASGPMERTFQQLQRCGVKVLVHDEEGFIHNDDDIYVNARLRFNTIKYVDMFLAWGGHQAGLLKNVVNEYQSDTEIVITGHPRIDLLRNPLRQIFEKPSNIRKQKRIILINTKLAECNHRLGPDGWLKILEDHFMIKTKEDRLLRLEQREYKKKMFSHYLILIEKLSESYPDSQIIVRPHPAEDKQKWIELMKKFTNVRVEWHHSIAFWLNIADVVIHTGCTTGVESVIMGKPTIAYKPIVDERFEAKLPNLVSVVARTPDEVVTLIKNNDMNDSVFKINNDDSIKIIMKHVDNIDGDLSADLIVESFNGLNILELDDCSFLKNIIKFRLLKLFKRFIAIFGGIRNVQQKIILKDDVESKIEDLSFLLGITQKISISEISNSVFLLYASKEV